MCARTLAVSLSGPILSHSLSHFLFHSYVTFCVYNNSPAFHHSAKSFVSYLVHGGSRTSTSSAGCHPFLSSRHHSPKLAWDRSKGPENYYYSTSTGIGDLFAEKFHFFKIAQNRDVQSGRTDTFTPICGKIG